MVDSVTVNTPEAGPIAPKEGEGTPPAGTGGERPEWLPEKFGSPEEMAKSYAELEAKLGGQAPKGEQTQQQSTTENTPAESTEVSYGKAVDAALAEAKLNPADVNAEWQEHGKLSDATYEALNNAGFPKEVVDTYVRGFERDAAAAEKAGADADADSDALMAEHFGGQEGFDRVSQWAASNLSAEDAEAYNLLVNEGTPEAARMAVLTLKAWYEAAEGKLPALIKGGGAGDNTGFASVQEMSAAMAKARASGDPAQIKAVEQKALRSNY